MKYGKLSVGQKVAIAKQIFVSPFHPSFLFLVFDPPPNSHACHAKGKREEAGQLLSSLTVLLLPRKFYFFLDPNLSRRETAFLPPRPK